MFQIQHSLGVQISASVLLTVGLVFASLHAFADTGSKLSVASGTVTAAPQAAPLASDDQERQYRDPTPAELRLEPSLRERVEARWATLIDGDFDAAYDFKSPAYRDRYDRKQHAASFGRMVDWHLASVQEVRYDREEEAEVIVSLTVSIPLNGGDMVRTTVPLPERWVYVDSQWYHAGEANQEKLPIQSD